MSEEVAKLVKTSLGLVAKSCPTVCNPLDRILPGPLSKGFFQAGNTEVGGCVLLGPKFPIFGDKG